MLKFGHVYLNHRFVTYDVGPELVEGRLVYVASLSQDPRVQVKASHAEAAVALLMATLGRLIT
ncbi:MAG: hypothetical protein JWM80_5827 [Cyanobacteria bacterium RYN_339]|nr:hypothetical protein [Cyanobacteria bacterium RYN_339]